MSQYDAEIDLGNLNNSQTALAHLVGHDKRVLDVGCWKGAFGATLAELGCTVSGVDLSADAVAAASQVLEDARVADLDRQPLSEVFEGSTFDVIVFGDVLEHLMDPLAVLRDAQRLLGSEGYVVMSIPNVTHGSVRLALLQGRWDYTTTGLLDRTHIRFFSRPGLLKLVRDAGYTVEVLQSTVVDVLSREVRYAEDDVPAGILDWVRHQPDAMTFQFILSARPGAEEPGTPAPVLSPLVPEQSLRPRDRFAQQRIEVEQLRHSGLLSRDHVLGLEAKVARLRRKAQAVAADREVLRQRLAQKNKTITRLRRRLGEDEQAGASSSGPQGAPPSAAARARPVRRRVVATLRRLGSRRG